MTSAPTELVNGLFTFPTTSVVAYGPGALREIPSLVERFGGRNVFAIATRWIDGLDARLTDALGERRQPSPRIRHPRSRLLRRLPRPIHLPG